MLFVYTNTINNSRQFEDTPFHQQRYTVFGKICIPTKHLG
jgi:hypothetical protein